MSSYPTREGVAEVIKIIHALAICRRELFEIEPQVQNLVARRDELKTVVGDLDRRLAVTFRSMDVDLPADGHGNFGWQTRLGVFVTELIRQMETPTV